MKKGNSTSKREPDGLYYVKSSRFSVYELDAVTSTTCSEVKTQIGKDRAFAKARLEDQLRDNSDVPGAKYLTEAFSVTTKRVFEPSVLTHGSVSPGFFTVSDGKSSTLDLSDVVIPTITTSSSTLVGSNLFKSGMLQGDASLETAEMKEVRGLYPRLTTQQTTSIVDGLSMTVINFKLEK